MDQSTKFRILKSLSLLVPSIYRAKIGLLYFRILSRRYSGNTVYCPCCNEWFREFLSKSNKNNVLCPGCLSLARHRLLWLFLENRTEFSSKNLRVLHFAPELCLIERFKSMTNLEYVTADLNSPLARNNVDITDMPYANESFDVVLCSHVLEHVPNDRIAMQELCRVLKPEGWAVIQCPIDTSLANTLEDPTVVTPEDRQSQYGHWDHVRMYGRDYQKRLEEAGFIVKPDKFATGLGPDAINKYRINDREDIFYCIKNNTEKNQETKSKSEIAPSRNHRT
jgi:SAM-dependent methyltransferase